MTNEAIIGLVEVTFKYVKEALQQADAHFCNGCRYEEQKRNKQPCVLCKRNQYDYWEQRSDEE